MRPVARPESAGEAAAPIRLNANQPPDRFYRGGERIARFRGAALRGGDRVPEDWIASTTSVRGQEPAGLTILPGGVTLSQAVADRPLWWLGESHVRAFGRDTRLLVKLLDAGQRLPVHAHPPTDFARSHLGAAHGKAEAWYILSPGVVHLGLTRALGADELREIVRTQQSGRL
ncbi:MAG: carbohydrate kinase, partial [Microbacterium sp.]|nr:carbohydrate kinase [Microbacterium sp.]